MYYPTTGPYAHTALILLQLSLSFFNIKMYANKIFQQKSTYALMKISLKFPFDSNICVNL